MPADVSEEFTMTLPRENVYALLTDPSRFARLLPGYESCTPIDDFRCLVKVRVELAQIGGTVNLEMARAEALPPERVLYRSRGTLMGSPITLDLEFTIMPASGHSRVLCTARADVSGKLNLLAGAVLEPMTRENVTRLIANIRTALHDHVAITAPMANNASISADEYSYEI